jgi:outer membrane lipoprotein carrier protein
MTTSGASGASNLSVSRFLLLLAAAPLLAQDVDLQKTLDKVEKRYNNAKTIQVPFEQAYLVQGRPRRTESGTLSLRKPGRMRWDYSNPAGKLFLSDGKHIYFYSPAANRVEKTPVKETEDVRAPLAFLLGKLDFSRDFREFRVRKEGEDLYIVAIPKSDKLPYLQADFVVTPEARIRRLVVTSQDQSQMDFQFGAERMNLPLDSSLFVFKMPQGAELVEMKGE